MPSFTNRLLGYPDDARLLILNADDFGMCQDINDAILQTLRYGLIRSTSLMLPGPAAPIALRYLAKHPELSFAIHLTASSDSPTNRWKPLSPPEKVRSLVGPLGYFYPFDQMQRFLSQLRLPELELEFRAQIDAAFAAGLRPSHLDWHALRISNRQDIFDLLFRLAREYGLALRVRGAEIIQNIQSRGFPTIDYDFLDSSGLDPETKPEEFVRLLRLLPPGLSEWAIHPGLDGPELFSIESEGGHSRQMDCDFWTSPTARDLIKAQGIQLIDYRALQKVWASQ
jgi:chitin disaccharide deacetylase